MLSKTAALPARADDVVIHRCPVCATRHAISTARAEMAYGRQLCCGPDCEGVRRRRARSSSHRILVA